jgi:3-deoxy-D-manno-octulosonate 8-phosphate phosphatase KdsC-like HAD superfamily phosphatase
MNDLPAFAAAGIAATVANARPEVKEKADLIAASYSELGVLQELRRIINARRNRQTVLDAFLVLEGSDRQLRRMISS